MESTLNERLSQLRMELGISQEDLGKKIGVSRFSISNYEAGKQSITERTIKDICREFKVSHIWLTQGIGDMFEDTENDLVTLIDNLLMGESETAKTLFRAFAELDESDWVVVQKVIDKLKNKPGISPRL